MIRFSIDEYKHQIIMQNNRRRMTKFYNEIIYGHFSHISIIEIGT